MLHCERVLTSECELAGKWFHLRRLGVIETVAANIRWTDNISIYIPCRGECQADRARFKDIVKRPNVYFDAYAYKREYISALGALNTS